MSPFATGVPAAATTDGPATAGRESEAQPGLPIHTSFASVESSSRINILVKHRLLRGAGGSPGNRHDGVVYTGRTSDTHTARVTCTSGTDNGRL